MTLYELLVNKMSDNVHDSMEHFCDDNTFYKSVGKAHMCNDLLELLSDETLKMEVTTRAAAIAKGETK